MLDDQRFKNKGVDGCPDNTTIAASPILGDGVV
jgi:hypothetical protein